MKMFFKHDFNSKLTDFHTVPCAKKEILIMCSKLDNIAIFEVTLFCPLQGSGK